MKYLHNKSINKIILIVYNQNIKLTSANNNCIEISNYKNGFELHFISVFLKNKILIIKLLD